MPQTGAAGSRRSSRGEASWPPAVAPFDPDGEISVTDRRSASRSAAASHAAAAEEFAARFGLDHGVSPVEISGRRTITITGHGAERQVPRRERDVRPRPVRRTAPTGLRADRAALWAVALCVLLVLVAAASAHAATFTTLR